MKGILRCVLLVVTGLLLLLMSGSAIVLLVRVFGMAFFFPAIVSLVAVFVKHGGSMDFGTVVNLVVDVGSLILGLWLMLAPSLFSVVFTKMLAAAILVLAVYHICLLVRFRRSGAAGLLVFIAPLALMAAALTVLAGAFDDEKHASVLLGVSSLIAGFFDMFLIAFVKKFSETVNSIEVDDSDAGENGSG